MQFPVGLPPPAVLPEERICEELYKQKFNLQIAAREKMRRESALEAAAKLREEIKQLGATPCA